MRLILLTQNKTAKVSDHRYAELAGQTWIAVHDKRENKWYARLGGKPVGPRMHRWIMGITDPNVLVDHKDGDGLNNQDDNLRIANHTQNNLNSIKKRSPSSSKYKGVSWDKIAKQWKARIYAYGKLTALGYSHVEEEAGFMYALAARIVAGEFAKYDPIFDEMAKKYPRRATKYRKRIKETLKKEEEK